MNARPLTALATLLVLAACARGPVVSYQDPSNSGDVGEIQAALAGKVTPVLALNSPFAGISDAQLSQTLAAGMPASLFANARFAGGGPEAGRNFYRIVFDFAASGAGSGSDGGCGASGAAAAPLRGGFAGPQHVAASMSLCRGSGPMSRAYGYVDGVNGADDPALRAFVERMATEILLYPMPAGGRGGGGSRSP
jgi:hypothetical protein